MLISKPMFYPPNKISFQSEFAKKSIPQVFAVHASDPDKAIVLEICLSASMIPTFRAVSSVGRAVGF